MMSRRFLSVLLVFVLILSMVPFAFAAGQNGSFDHFRSAKTYPEGKFSDVPETQWYAESVVHAYELGLVSGNTAKTYGPDENLTIAQCLAFACRLHSIFHTGTADLKQGDPWYQVYVDYAVGNGIIQTGDFSNYNKVATRREVAYIFAHALPEEALPAINEVVFKAIPDVSMMGQYGKEIYQLYQAGIIGGFDKKGTFYPDSPILRSHIAAMVVRMAVPEERVSVTLTEVSALPDTFERVKSRGLQTIVWAETSYPEAFGLPKLTNEEIDWLIAQQNPKLAAAAISTFGDCLNYFMRADFRDYDSNYQPRDWFTHMCGEQVIARGGGTCGGMCNALAYMLRNDYEDLAYVLIEGHVAMYLFTGGKYYFLNPVDYANADNPIKIRTWMDGIYVNEVICADSFQTIADSFVQGGWTKHVHTYPAAHDMLPHKLEGDNHWIFPAGSKVTSWIPNSTVISYESVPASFGYDWKTNCWLSESLVSPGPGTPLKLPGDYPGRF